MEAIYGDRIHTAIYGYHLLAYALVGRALETSLLPAVGWTRAARF